MKSTKNFAQKSNLFTKKAFQLPQTVPACNEEDNVIKCEAIHQKSYAQSDNSSEKYLMDLEDINNEEDKTCKRKTSEVVKTEGSAAPKKRKTHRKKGTPKRKFRDGKISDELVQLKQEAFEHMSGIRSGNTLDKYFKCQACSRSFTLWESLKIHQKLCVSKEQFESKIKQRYQSFELHGRPSPEAVAEISKFEKPVQEAKMALEDYPSSKDCQSCIVKEKVDLSESTESTINNRCGAQLGSDSYVNSEGTLDSVSNHQDNKNQANAELASPDVSFPQHILFVQKFDMTENGVVEAVLPLGVTTMQSLMCDNVDNLDTIVSITPLQTSEPYTSICENDMPASTSTGFYSQTDQQCNYNTVEVQPSGNTVQSSDTNITLEGHSTITNFGRKVKTTEFRKGQLNMEEEKEPEIMKKTYAKQGVMSGNEGSAITEDSTQQEAKPRGKKKTKVSSVGDQTVKAKHAPISAKSTGKRTVPSKLKGRCLRQEMIFPIEDIPEGIRNLASGENVLKSKPKKKTHKEEKTSNAPPKYANKTQVRNYSEKSESKANHKLTVSLKSRKLSQHDKHLLSSNTSEIIDHFKSKETIQKKKSKILPCVKQQGLANVTLDNTCGIVNPANILKNEDKKMLTKIKPRKYLKGASKTIISSEEHNLNGKKEVSNSSEMNVPTSVKKSCPTSAILGSPLKTYGDTQSFELTCLTCKKVFASLARLQNHERRHKKCRRRQAIMNEYSAWKPDLSFLQQPLTSSRLKRSQVISEDLRKKKAEFEDRIRQRYKKDADS